MEDGAAQATSVASVARLWRAQGTEFLAAIRAELEADIERLRREPDPPAPPPDVVPDVPAVPVADEPAVAIDLRQPVDVRDALDLRDAPLAHRFCAGSKHGPEVATVECGRCHLPFCAGCVIDDPRRAGAGVLCLECALGMAVRPRSHRVA